MSNLFQNIFNLNLERVENDWDKRGFRIINTLIFSLGILMLLFYLLSFVISLSEARPVVLGMMAITIIHFWVSKKLPFNVIKLYASLIPIVLISIVSISIIGEGGGDRFYFACSLILPMIFYKEKKWWLPLVLLNIVAFIASTFLQQYIEPMASISDQELFFYAGINGIAICSLILIMLKVFKIEIDGFQQTITDQKQTLEIKNKEITESINYAKGIQEAILPSAHFLEREFKHGFICYLPKDIVAGDFYWIEKVEDDLYFAAADCTGHGVPGAMVSVVCSNALQQSLHEYRHTNTSDLLESTSQLVSKTFEKSIREIKDGMDIGLCRWNAETGMLQFSGANNPLWLISNSSELKTNSDYKTIEVEGRYLHEVKGTKRPVGNSDIKMKFELHEIQLEQGDEIILQTDGFADQFGGTNGKKYKYNQLKMFLLKTKSIDRSEILKREFSAWCEGYEQIDDVCLIGLRI